MHPTLLGSFGAPWDAAVALMKDAATPQADKDAAKALIVRTQQAAADAVAAAKATLAREKAAKNTAAAANAQAALAAATAKQAEIDAAAKAAGLSPFYKQFWFWGVVGLAAAGGVTYWMWPKGGRSRSRRRGRR